MKKTFKIRACSNSHIGTGIEGYEEILKPFNLEIKTINSDDGCKIKKAYITIEYDDIPKLIKATGNRGLIVYPDEIRIYDDWNE